MAITATTTTTASSRAKLSTQTLSEYVGKTGACETKKAIVRQKKKENEVTADENVLLLPPSRKPLVLLLNGKVPERAKPNKPNVG